MPPILCEVYMKLTSRSGSEFFAYAVLRTANISLQLEGDIANLTTKVIAHSAVCP